MLRQSRREGIPSIEATNIKSICESVFYDVTYVTQSKKNRENDID